MRVAVTGGAGYIGSRLVHRLVVDGYDVVVVDNLSKGSLEPLKHLIEGRHITLNKNDIREMQVTRNTLRGCEAVVHLAAVSSVPEAEADPYTAFEVNVVGTENILKSCVELGIGRIIFASSAAVYGDLPSPASELAPPNPLNVYGCTKLLGERLAESYCRAYACNGLALRLFNVYGGTGGVGVVDKYLKSSKSHQPLEIFGDGLQVRDFIHIDDVVEAFMKALSCLRLPNYFTKLNVGTGRGVTILELAQKFLKVFNIPPTHLTFLDGRVGEIRYSVADVSQAKAILGFEAAHTIDGWLMSQVGGGDA